MRRYLNRWAKYYYILPFFCAGLLYVNMYLGIVGGFGFLVFCLKMSKHRIVKISCSRCSANLKISLRSINFEVRQSGFVALLGGFEGGIKLEFHGAKVTSDGGLLAYRELDDALGLFDAVSTALSDQRTGRNIQHAMATLLRQSIYSRLAGYEDVNDAERLSVDPVMRALTGKRAPHKERE